MRNFDTKNLASLISLMAFCWAIYEHIHNGHDAIFFMFIALYLTLI